MARVRLNKERGYGSSTKGNLRLVYVLGHKRWGARDDSR